MHLHSKGSFATLGEAPKDITEECKACYNWRCVDAKVTSRSLKIGSMVIIYFPRVCGDLTLNYKGPNIEIWKIYQFVGVD